MNKFIIYTAIFGGKDNLREVEKFPGIDYVCFTDNKILKSSSWEIKVVDPRTNSNRMNAKIFKILPHNYFPNHQYSVWIDGSIGVRSNPRQFLLDSLKGYDIAMFDHGRNCIYDEAEVCSKYKKDDPEIIEKHMERYRNEGAKSFENVTWGSIYVGPLRDFIAKNASQIENFTPWVQVSLSYGAKRWLNQQTAANMLNGEHGPLWHLRCWDRTDGPSPHWGANWQGQAETIKALVDAFPTLRTNETDKYAATVGEKMPEELANV